jgi:integrase
MASYIKRGDTWTVRFRVLENNEQKQKRLSGFNTKKEARDAYAKFTILQHSKPTIKLTIQELFELFVQYKESRIKYSSLSVFTQFYKKHILPYFSQVKVVNITKQDIISWQAKINAKHLAYNTKSLIYNTFVSLINYGIDYHDLLDNVVSKVGNFKNREQKKPISFWTDSEFTTYITVANDIVYKTLFSTLYLTGARIGEAMGLLWKDINLNDGILNINKTYSYRPKGISYELTTTKTKSSTRLVIIPNALINLLSQLKEYYKTFEGFDENCFVFGMSKPLQTLEIKRRHLSYCKLANVKPIKIHDFRHSHASLLINKGQNILLVSQRLGHSDVNMTLNTYSHLFPNKQRELMDSLNIDLN